MDLNLGGLVRQTTAPVLDAVSLVRAAGVDQIASFLRDNPDQRGVIETALATGGRAGDLSTIVERAGFATGQGADVIRDTAGAAAQSVSAADGGTLTRVVTAAVDVVGRAGDVVGQTLGRVTGTIADVPARTAQAVGGETVSRGATMAANVVGRAGEAAGQTLGRVNGASGEVALRSAQTTGATVGRSLGGTAEALTGPMQRGETLARLSGDPANSTLSNGLGDFLRGKGVDPAPMLTAGGDGVAAARAIDGWLDETLPKRPFSPISGDETPNPPAYAFRASDRSGADIYYSFLADLGLLEGEAVRLRDPRFDWTINDLPDFADMASYRRICLIKPGSADWQATVFAMDEHMLAICHPKMAPRGNNSGHSVGDVLQGAIERGFDPR